MNTAQDYLSIGGGRESSGGGPAATPFHLNTGQKSPRHLIKIYPECGEASIALAVSEVDDVSGRWERLDEEERQRCNWERANRRAAARLRRYMVANSLVFMWVLTISEDGLHGAEGRREVMRMCAAFAKRMRRELGVECYAYSPELHPGGHGWHVNFFVGSYLPHARVAELWGHGHVWVSDWRQKVRKRPGMTSTQVAKSAALNGARYAAKYAEKDWSRDVLEDGAHRFERSEGHDPALVEAEAPSVGEALRAVMTKVTGEYEIVWSDDIDDYEGPPWVFVRWEPER